MNYEVKIDAFEGPLDLLLHLIKESKMDIINIRIEEITNQYLEYISNMTSLNLNVASEYLTMASELVEIKSKMLLPKHEELEEEEDFNPEEKLINRLIEYQRYKDMTSKFKEMEQIRQEIYTKSPENITKYVDEEVTPISDVTLDDLINAFQKFLERQKENVPLSTKITSKEITVEERRIAIKNILREKRKVNFLELFDTLTKEYIVVTFLAILEMCRKNELTITQENNFSEIICEVK
ncbi:MAG: segregation/condensation protein A [Bacilli bacterium]|nr:segregation/condensation protein A [Bacilli bacterium]